MRYKHYSLSTEKLCGYLIRFFSIRSGRRHPIEMGLREVEEFLTMFANKRRVFPCFVCSVLCVQNCLQCDKVFETPRKANIHQCLRHLSV
ncbi:phage integrase N-terminal SAM-like domain-containing protein [Undibacterium nitidum]|uniref:phage integrase N-terminal SAM-like domain-containing protein n=1 Tax=Undibacterium nitidum TaxID=2762298 RepID=UPI0038B477BD